MTRFCNIHIPDLQGLPDLLAQSAKSQMSNFGPLYRSFCEDLADIFQLTRNQQIHVVSSGHIALMAAYSALGCKRLVMPAYTFESTRIAATLQGIEPVIVDVDPQTGCLTLEILEQVPEPFDSVVVVCALSTIPNLAEIDSWCRRTGKKLIIDGAATFGTPWIYQYGDAFCLSFHATKSFPLGEGGAVICKTQYSHAVKSFINFGFDENRVPISPGLNGKVSEYTCAIGKLLLAEIQPALDRRLDNVDIYREFGLAKYMLCERDFVARNARTVYQCLPIFLPISLVEKVRVALTNIGVEWKQYYRPLISSASVATDLYSRNICLPCHPDVTVQEIEKIIFAFKAIGL